MNRAATALPLLWAFSGILSPLFTYYFLGSQLGFDLTNLIRAIMRDQASGLMASIIVGLTYALMLKQQTGRQPILVIGYLHLTCMILAFIARFFQGLGEMHRLRDLSSSNPLEHTGAQLLLDHASVILMPLGFSLYIIVLVIALRAKSTTAEAF